MRLKGSLILSTERFTCLRGKVQFFFENWKSSASLGLGRGDVLEECWRV